MASTASTMCPKDSCSAATANLPLGNLGSRAACAVYRAVLDGRRVEGFVTAAPVGGGPRSMVEELVDETVHERSVEDVDVLDAGGGDQAVGFASQVEVQVFAGRCFEDVEGEVRGQD